LFHSTFVVQTLLGRAVGWSSQPRSDRGVRWREAFARQKWQLLFGVVWGAVLLRRAPHFFWWLTPVLFGLLCGIALTVLTSGAGLGRLALRLRLLLVPEESSQPPELVAVRRFEVALARHDPAPVATSSGRIHSGSECSPAPTGLYGKLPFVPMSGPCEGPACERRAGERP